MKENKFITHFEKKSTAELQDILADKKGYQSEARSVAAHILKTRDGIFAPDELAHEKERNSKKYDFKKIEASLKKEHRFGWTPKFEKSFRTDLNNTVFFPITIEAFEKLDWSVVFQDENSVEAIYHNSWAKQTEKIEVTFNHGEVTVKSISLTSSFWDGGRNSKRVKLFMHVFNETEKAYDKEALHALEKETEKINNWDDYEVPKTLPKPKRKKKPNVLIPILGGISSALLLGFIIALLSTEGLYFLFLFEIGVAFILGFIFASLIKLGNYTNYKNLHALLIITILITYISNQFFQYQIVLYQNNGVLISFIEFLQFRIEAGLVIKNLELGSIGLVLSWAFQLIVTYLVGIIRLSLAFSTYQFERIPGEVIEFTIYHFIKGKSEQEVRYELSKMGWQNKDHQDEVLESLEGLHDLKEYNRAV